MLKGLLAAVCLLWIIEPGASAQGADRPAPIAVYDDVAFENLCAPDLLDGLYEETRTMTLDDAQLARLRIELLERGWDPGFDPDAVDADARLAAAIREFQAQNSLPVTGEADTATLFLLSVPIAQPGYGGV